MAGSSDHVLKALEEVRGAMERAVRALEKSDADAASVAVSDAERAAERMRQALAYLGGKPPAEALAAAKRVMALSSLALLHAGNARERVGAEIESLAVRKRGVRGYRPTTPDGGGVDEQS
ncbi:MAG TPA: hypothetical protein VKE69_08585 [Planctomycetota bacterium]|nr:hypothetical protein [Planctomycetota bacterium]